MADRLSFIILSWNSEQTIEQCLKSIEKKCNEESISYEMIIVDNGSTDKTVEIINSCTETMPIDLVRFDKNKGTTVTRNMAIARSTGNYICVIDSDTVILNGSLTGLIEELSRNEEIGILAPQLIETTGGTQLSVKRFPSMFGKLSRIPGILFRKPLRDYDAYGHFPFDCMTEVDCAISACWFFRRELLEDVGLLDERIFYAPEDVDYCIRVWKSGKTVVYYPHVTVLHQTQRITHKKALSSIAISHLFGLLYYFCKHRYITSPTLPEKEPGEKENW